MVSDIHPEGQVTMANCNTSLTTFDGYISDYLIHFFIIYCYAICLIGTLCNVVALWCVVGCPKTPTAVKVLLCALFSTTLLMCLLVMPFMAHVGISKVLCDRQVPRWLIHPIIAMYIILAQMELMYIANMAFLRALAVWSSRRLQVKMCKAIALSIGIGIYSIVATIVLVLVPLWGDILSDDESLAVVLIYNAVNFLVPVMFTIACYLSMILAVRRNKYRLTATPDTAATVQVMDQATRSMLAVFISNLLFSLPHSTYHTLPVDEKAVSYVPVHIVFFTHLFVDPLVFVCFNLHHRQRVLYTLKSCLQRKICKPTSALPQATSTLPLHLTSTTDEPRQEPI